MEPYEVLDIVLKTSDVLAEEYGGKDLIRRGFDFVSASVLCRRTIIPKVQDLHKNEWRLFCNG